MEGAASLYTTEAKMTRGLQCIAVEYDFIYGPVIVVESCQWSDCPIHHRTVETGSRFRGDSISQGLHLLLHCCRVFLKGSQKASVLESQDASRMLLQFLLILGFFISLSTSKKELKGYKGTLTSKDINLMTAAFDDQSTSAWA